MKRTLLLLPLSACGGGAFTAPDSARGRWNPEEATSLWTNESAQLENLAVRLDGSAPVGQLGGRQWLEHWLPRGARVEAGASGDADSDRIPARIEVDLDEVEDPSGISYSGSYRLRDDDDMDVYSGYALEFDGVKARSPEGASLATVEGQARLERKEDRFVQRVALRTGPLGGRGVFADSVIVPDDMRAPELLGRVESFSGFLETSASGLVLAFAGRNLVYDWHCGTTPFRSGTIVLNDGEGNSLRVDYEDCRAKEPVFGSKS